MKKENNFLKEKIIKDENGEEWEVCSKKDNSEEYEYKEIETTILKTNDFTFNALQRFIDYGIKTNIHFIYSNMSHGLAIDILEGKDIWKGKVNIKKLNAVIFLLFKPQGSGKELKHLVPTQIQLEVMSKRILEPKCKFKVGMDSCLANHVLKYQTPEAFQAMSIDTCEAARMSGYITPDMKFKPCSFAGCNTEVDLKDSSIETIWNKSESFSFYRDILKENPQACPIGF